MSENRDDFTKATIDILAKRVGYLCSNPDCRKSLIGPSVDGGKAITIGVAAHITAAAGKGPRFDISLEPEQRKHIDNAVWLCSNCAALIDKDIKRYTVNILQQWKAGAEEESRKKLNGEYIQHPIGTPYLEVDLIHNSRSRWNRGYSAKNPVEVHKGVPVMVLPNKPIIHWGLAWNFKFVIYNNSSVPAYNIKIESVGTIHFKQLDILSKINNLPPLGNIDLKASFEDFVEGDHTVADDMLKCFPESFKYLLLKLSYFDESRRIHQNEIEFDGQEILNRKV